MAIENEFYNLHATYVTMKHDSSIVYASTEQHGSAQVGKAVQMHDEGEVALVETGNEIFGKLIKVESDGYCTVQDGGYCDLPYDGSPAYTENDNGLLGGATAGNVAPAGAAPANGAVRTARAIKSDVTGRIIVKL
jgi:hypothetical protein